MFSKDEIIALMGITIGTLCTIGILTSGLLAILKLAGVFALSWGTVVIPGAISIGIIVFLLALMAGWMVFIIVIEIVRD